MKLKSIRVQILAIVLVCYLVPTLLLGQYMGRVFFADLQEKTEQALTSGAEHARTLTVQQIERAIDLSKDATYDGELTQAFSAYAGGSMSSGEAMRVARTYLERKYGRENLFTFAACFSLNAPDTLIYSRSGFDRARVYQLGAHERVKGLGETLDTRCLFIQEGEDVYLIRNLYNLKMERYGMLVLGVDMDGLTAPIAELALSWDARADMRVGDAGELALDWDALSKGLSDSGEADELTYAQHIRERDYELGMRLTVSKHRVYGEIEAFRQMMRGLFFLLIPVMALILIYVNRRIVRPITILSQASRRIEAGEWGLTVPMHGGDELGDLGRAFSSMSAKIANLIDKTYKEEIALRDARIQAMQSRINPHFINNALESINWQARIEGSQTVSAMVESLSVLLNASMAKGNRRMVPLAEEAEVARAYFYFISQRFGDRLQVRQELDERALSMQLPLLTIQPLLENAVEHGIAPAGGGEIALSCRVKEGMLHITVANSGRELSEENRRRIDLALSGDTQGGNHLGLANIASRLRLIYGGDAQIAVMQDERGRTQALLRIPALCNPVQEGEPKEQNRTTNNI
ncbi:MAG: sensor histidine kinase [Clostridia bacterium]|nr:sensor histidine kinase [Clostridia bacterium]